MSIPLVSVCITTYNRKKFLKEAIDSIYGQSGMDKEDIEIIIVDDNSTDGVGDMARDMGCVVLHNPDGPTQLKPEGIWPNFRRSFLEAKGKYLCILGSDDVFNEYKFISQIKLLQDNSNASCAYSHFQIFYDDGARKRLGSIHKYAQEYTSRLVSGHMFCCAVTCLYDREKLMKACLRMLLIRFRFAFYIIYVIYTINEISKTIFTYVILCSASIYHGTYIVFTITLVTH